jgi:hypothetical protein|tara:strand:- start:1226 stop:1555 length:330 start_codon:yes stop_codon:yes gene_type:complete
MADTYKYVQGDTGPQIKVTITSADGTATDLTGGSVTLHFRAAGETTVLFSRVLVNSNQTTDTGKTVLQFQDGDLNVDAGNYEGELETILTGLRETRYELLKFKIREDFA